MPILLIKYKFKLNGHRNLADRIEYNPDRVSPIMEKGAGASSIMNRLTFLEGEWKGEISNRDSRSRYEDILVCRRDGDRISCESTMYHNGEAIVHRGFDLWLEDDTVLGSWKLDGEDSGIYECEYEAEKDEFLFNLRDYPTSVDYRTIRRIDMMHFITMEQLPREGTSSVETLQVEYSRTL